MTALLDVLEPYFVSCNQLQEAGARFVKVDLAQHDTVFLEAEQRWQCQRCSRLSKVEFGGSCLQSEATGVLGSVGKSSVAFVGAEIKVKAGHGYDSPWANVLHLRPEHTQSEDLKDQGLLYIGHELGAGPEAQRHHPIALSRGGTFHLIRVAYSGFKVTEVAFQEGEYFFRWEERESVPYRSVAICEWP